MAATDQKKVRGRERAHFGRKNSSRCRRESLPRIQSGRGGFEEVNLAMTLSEGDTSQRYECHLHIMCKAFHCMVSVE